MRAASQRIVAPQLVRARPDRNGVDTVEKGRDWRRERCFRLMRGPGGGAGHDGQTGDQSQLFYLFNLEERVPARHLLRLINPTVTRVLAGMREKLTSTGMPVMWLAHLSTRLSSRSRVTNARRSRCASRI